MNDVMEQIKTLSATLDEETTRFHPTGRLLLLGSYESVFLKAVKRKADLLGIDCDLTQYPCPPYKAVVVDRETVPSDIKLAAVEWIVVGCLFLWRLRHWNRRFSELYDELRKEIDHE